MHLPKYPAVVKILGLQIYYLSLAKNLA